MNIMNSGEYILYINIFIILYKIVSIYIRIFNGIFKIYFEMN